MPCNEPVCLSWLRGYCEEHSHHDPERKKKSILSFRKMQGTSSNCCITIMIFPAFSSGNTLIQIHASRQRRTLSMVHGVQGQPHSWWGHSSPPTQLPSLTKTVRGIPMTNARRPFKSRFWKIFLLQENVHDVALKKKKNRKQIKSSRDNN